MKESPTIQIDEIVSQANKVLAEAQASLQELIDDTSLIDAQDDSSINQPQRLQLILQYRLDTQDAIKLLMQIDHGIFQILGIAAQQTAKMNIERMQYALGIDDFHHILSALSQLVSALMRIASRYQQKIDRVSQQKHHQQALRLNSKSMKAEQRLQKAVTQQKRFISLLQELSSHLDEWNKLAVIGPVLDHISALQGPVSHFFQAIQHGLALTHILYEKTNKDAKLDHTLANILQQAEAVLKHIPPVYQPQHFFTPEKIDTDERLQLEQRAAMKRLGHFFRHP